MEIGKRILITGSSGFLGKSLCKEMQEAGYIISTFDILQGNDILDYKQVLASLKNCDACLHLAAVSDLYIADSNPEQCDQLNIEGTKVVAKACNDINVKLLYASTCCVYGNNNIAISNEECLPSPSELYAESKLQGEVVVKNSGCDYRILRLATFYGWNMRASLATSLFLKKNILGEVIDIHGTGEQTRCYTHVDDVSHGIRIAYEKSKIPEIINIADDVAYSVIDLIQIIEKITGKKSITRFVKDREGQIINGSINSDLLKNYGWKPKWTLEQGLKDYFEVNYPKVGGS